MASSHVDEYTVHVPKLSSKKYNVMQFNTGDQVDIRRWTDAALTRDLSAKRIYVEDDIYPEFGEGSEYGRKQREQARKLKYGRKDAVFKVEDQPWFLNVSTIVNEPDVKKKINGKVPTDVKPKVAQKEFSGKKEGGIGEGSVYFIFTQRPDFTFEAYPVQDWYNFRRKIAHRTLTDEEAEAAWDKRDKILNHLNYMARKRLHIKDEADEEGNGEATSLRLVNKREGKKSTKERSGLVIHDDEDHDLYMSDSSSESESEGSKKKKKKKEKVVKSDDEKEGFEDSDDGEHDGDEVAYASDVSSENEEVNDSRVVPKGLDEIESSSSSEEEEEQDKNDSKDNENQNKLHKAESDESASSAESGSDIDDEDSLSNSAVFMQAKKFHKDRKSGKGSSSNSRSPTPNIESAGSAGKLKMAEAAKKLDNKGRRSPLTNSSILGKRSAGTVKTDGSSKRQKVSHDRSVASSPAKDTAQAGITEDAVLRHLTHKPITTKDLLKKFKTKKTGISSEEIVERVAKILKKLDPQKITLNGRMHLFLKAT